jgi:hypothetical protein
MRTSWLNGRTKVTVSRACHAAVHRTARVEPLLAMVDERHAEVSGVGIVQAPSDVAVPGGGNGEANI